VVVFVSFAVAAAVTLYLWLLGHWFGRVLAFLAFAALFVVAGFVIDNSRTLTGELAALILGPVLGWLVASVPTWLYARQARAPVFYPPAGTYPPPGRSITLR
jgi:hypothetical protein